ncbi:hypothetical protein BJX96DRAFT_166649 [Aspergillus floccosus]
MTRTVNSYTARTSRKSHKKSRLGCTNCKARRIKCDEGRPSCFNCIRHSVQCSYSHLPGVQGPSKGSEAILTESKAQDDFTFISSWQAQFKPPKRSSGKRRDLAAEYAQRSLTPEPSTAIAHKPFQFTATDMALFHHFMSCANLGADRTQWQSRMTRWGFQHHYLLHLFLALSGFHLARDLPRYLHMQQIIGQEVDYAAEAEKHYEIAVRGIASVVPQLTADNGLVLYTGAVFIFICALARGPQPGEYLAFRDDGNAGCLALFMGVRSILEICSNVLALDVSTSHMGSVQDISPESGEQAHRPSIADEGSESDPLGQLRFLLYATYPSVTYLDYARVLDRLKQTYDIVRPQGSLLTGIDPFPHVFGWLYMLPDSFLLGLQQQQPLELTIFSFFVVLLKDMDVAWFIQGWPEHIMSGIWESLDEYHRDFVQWPMQKLS